MMNPGPRKRGRETFDEGVAGSTSAVKDHLACDQCRIKKIKCGKERPQCSNCRRLSIDCDWTGNGKKTNQTVLMSQSISGIGDRLDKLDNTVARIETLVQQLDLSNLQPRPVSTPVSAFIGTSPQMLPLIESLSDVTRSQFTLQGSDGSERCFGPTSLKWLMYNFGNCAKEYYDQSDSTYSATYHNVIMPASEKMRHLIQSEMASSPSEEESLLNTPPLMILEALMGPFFETVNPHFPIWTSEVFCVLAHKSKNNSEVPQDRAFAICANNLVILALTAKVLHTRATQLSHRSSSIEADLVKTFTENARRALVNVEQLLEPTLLNVQALLSLCLVAQQHLGEYSFALTLALTVQVATAMGLHRIETSSNSRFSEVEMQERRNVIYCISFLERSQWWNQGPTHGRSFGASISPTPIQQTDHGTDYLHARFMLSKVEDQIYMKLYSSQAVSANATSVARTTIVGLLEELEKWRIAHAVELEGPRDCNTFDAYIETELAFLFLQTKTRILWPLIRHAPAARVVAKDARTSIGLFIRLWTSTSEQGHYASLSRLIFSFSPTSIFHMIMAHITREGEDNADLEQFKEFASVLQAISGCAAADSYVSKFSDFVQSLLFISAEISERRKSDSQKVYGHSLLGTQPVGLSRAQSSASVPEQESSLKDSMEWKEDLSSTRQRHSTAMDREPTGFDLLGFPSLPSVANDDFDVLQWCSEPSLSTDLSNLEDASRAARSFRGGGAYADDWISSQ